MNSNETSKRQAQYFVLAKSLWQGDTWSAIAGAFNSKAEAEQVANQLANNGMTPYGQDLKAVVNTCVVSKTKMQRVYKIDLESAYNNIAWVNESRADQMRIAAEGETIR